MFFPIWNILPPSIREITTLTAHGAGAKRCLLCAAIDKKGMYDREDRRDQVK
jgi:hypothetical protein